MATNSFVVRLIDCPGGTDGVSGHAASIGSSLSMWFQSVCQRATAGSTVWTADVQWLAQPPSSTPSQDAGSPLTVNLVIFFVPGPAQGVIRLHPQFRTATQPAEGDQAVWGTTVSQWSPPGAQAGRRTPVLGISEVYISRCRTTNDAATQLNLARTGFHECMHNQLIRPGNDLHRGNAGFAADTPTGNAPTAQNTQSMATAIGTLVPQWLAGFQAWRTNSMDPLGGI
jgi:hypothetical protein